MSRSIAWSDSEDDMKESDDNTVDCQLAVNLLV